MYDVMNNYMHYTVWSEITYPFPNTKDAISNFTPNFTGHVIRVNKSDPR